MDSLDNTFTIVDKNTNSMYFRRLDDNREYKTKKYLFSITDKNNYPIFSAEYKNEEFHIIRDRKISAIFLNTNDFLYFIDKFIENHTPKIWFRTKTKNNLDFIKQVENFFDTFGTYGSGIFIKYKYIVKFQPLYE